MAVRVTVKGDQGVSRKLRAYADRAANVEKAWPSVGAYLSRMVRQQFSSEGRRLGTPWKPLKPEYRLWKMRNGYNRKILVMTGAMRNKFIRRPMDIEQYRGNEAIFGSSDQKAVWQNFGTRRHGKRVIPPRKIMPVTPEIRRDVRDILERRITGRLP